MLFKQPGFTITVAFTLSIGIATSTTVFSVINALLLKPFPYEEPDKLVSLFSSSDLDQFKFYGLSAPDFRDIRDQSHAFEAIAHWDWEPFNLAGEGEPIRCAGARVSANLFSILRVKPLLGRTFLQNDDAPSAEKIVVLSEGLWQSQFGGDTNLLGKTIMLDAVPRVVVGVIPDGAEFPSDAKLWVPRAFELITSPRDIRWVSTVARLNEKTTIELAQAELTAIAKRLEKEYPNSNSGRVIDVVSLSETRLGPAKGLMFLLFIAIGLLLLIVCANVANLLLSRSVTRVREFSLRASLGAGPSRLIRQILTECSILAVLGCLLGVLASWYFIELLTINRPSDAPAWYTFTLDFRVWLFGASISIGAVLLSGLLPALRISKPDLNLALKETGNQSTSGRRSSRLQHGLVVLQLIMALTLLASAGMAVQGFLGLSREKAGFELENRITATMALSPGKYSEPSRRIQFHNQLLDRVAALPGVIDVGVVSHLPLGNYNRQSRFSVEGQSQEAFLHNTLPFHKAVSPDYFRTMGIPLFRGRHFSAFDNTDARKVAIINQQLADRYWKGDDPVGKRLRLDGPASGSPLLEIVGVVGNVKQMMLHEPPPPHIYVPFEQGPGNRFSLVAHTFGNSDTLAGPIRNAVRDLDPHQALYRVTRLEKVVQGALWYYQMFSSLFWYFGLVALGLAGVGTYGVMAHATSQRTQEIGIRMSLGARHTEMLTMVLRQGLWIASIGIGIGLICATAVVWMMGTAVEGMQSPQSVNAFSLGAASLLLGTVSLLACYLPARRASRIEPMQALRYE